MTAKSKFTALENGLSSNGYEGIMLLKYGSFFVAGEVSVVGIES
jgi:hypothetical protein